MVKKLEKGGKVYYQCEECGYYYDTEGLAKECENWCKEHKACNSEIIKQSIGKEEINYQIFSYNIQQLLIGVLLGGVLVFLFFNFKLSNSPTTSNLSQPSNQQTNFNQELYQQIINQVLPSEGFKTRLVLGDVVKKMVDCGVIDLEKMQKLYNGQIPEYLQKLINGYYEPLVIDQETANYLLNIFWPLGLSNKTEFNKNIPFSEKDLPNLASTGGWWLGKKDNGAEYFNKCEIIKLTPKQEEIVYKVAQNTFRPCCDNSTFAQDCNHGSALLGALELAVSQGYSKDELYKLALQLNSFWFPQNYIKIAVYLKLVENIDWQNVDPKEIMSAKYSSISGYLQNVEQKLAKLNLPQFQIRGGGCGL